jgi:hypothetical protein
VNPVSGVMRAMADAASSVKLADISMNVFRQATAKGADTDVDHAAVFTADSMHTAVQESQGAQEGFKQAQLEAQQQESARRQRAIENAKARAQERARRRQALEEARGTSGEAETPAEDSVDPDSEGTGRSDSRDGADQAAGFQPGKNSDALHKPEGEAASGVLYTHLGGVRPTATDKKLSVTV